MTRSPSDTAFHATFASFRLIPSRKVSQLIFEVPIEATDNALSVLGGVPNPEKTRWVGIAPIEVKPKLSGKDIWRASAECAMICKETDFWEYLRVSNEAEALEEVRRACGMVSRSELDCDSQILSKWMDFKCNYWRWKENQARD